MEKKGQLAVGGIVLMALAVIVVVALLPQIAQNQGKMTGTFTETVPNALTANATSGGYNTSSWSNTTATALRGQELIGTPTVVNFSGAVDCSNNFTFYEGVDTASNTKRILVVRVGSYTTDKYCGQVNLTWTGGDVGYIDDVGGRSIAGLVVFLCCLGLLGAAIYYYIRNNSWLGSFQ